MEFKISWIVTIPNFALLRQDFVRIRVDIEQSRKANIWMIPRFELGINTSLDNLGCEKGWVGFWQVYYQKHYIFDLENFKWRVLFRNFLSKGVLIGDMSFWCSLLSNLVSQDRSHQCFHRGQIIRNLRIYQLAHLQNWSLFPIPSKPQESKLLKLNSKPSNFANSKTPRSKIPP